MQCFGTSVSSIIAQVTAEGKELELFLLRYSSDEKDSQAGVLWCRYRYKLVVPGDDSQISQAYLVTSSLCQILRNGLLSLKGSHSVFDPFQSVREFFSLFLVHCQAGKLVKLPTRVTLAIPNLPEHLGSDSGWQPPPNRYLPFWSILIILPPPLLVLIIVLSHSWISWSPLR